MSELYTIKDERTVYCRVAMKANGGEWNPVTSTWMFRDGSEHANALVELYRVTRPSVAMREALQAMITDGTGALAWGFDPAEKPLAIDEIDRTEASNLIAAGYAVRRVLGVHSLDDAEQTQDDTTAIDVAKFEARANRRRRQRAA